MNIYDYVYKLHALMPRNSHIVCDVGTFMRVNYDDDNNFDVFLCDVCILENHVPKEGWTGLIV